MRYRPDSKEDAHTTAEHARDWLEELAFMPHLGHDGEHAVAEALRALQAVCSFLGRTERSAQCAKSATT